MPVQMNALALSVSEVERLPDLIQRASSMLADAVSAGEVLEAGRLASVAYTAARLAARLLNARKAHDHVQAVARRVMGDAILIEARCQCLLADEVDLAQQRGELRVRGDNKDVEGAKNRKPGKVGLAEFGITSGVAFRARVMRDAMQLRPDFAHDIIEARLQNAQPPTRRQVQLAAREISRPDSCSPRPKTARPAVVFDDEEFAGGERFDVSRVWDLVERTRAKYAKSPDISALCNVAAYCISLHLRSVRVARQLSVGLGNGGGVEACVA
jgi:hypothetical protein